VVLRLLAPSLTRRSPDPGLPGLVARSDDSLAYFALREDRSSVRAGDAVVSYGRPARSRWPPGTRSAQPSSGPARSARSWPRRPGKAASPP
jgi:hypothetical protein